MLHATCKVVPVHMRSTEEQQARIIPSYHRATGRIAAGMNETGEEGRKEGEVGERGKVNE